MDLPWLTRCAVAGLLVLGTPLSVAAQTVTTNQTLDDCKLIPDDGARLACYDRVIKAGRADIVSTPESTPTQSGSQPTQSAAKTPEELRAQRERDFGLTKGKTEAAREEEPVDEITVEVASTGVITGGKLRIVATNGMVWDQLEGAPPPAPKAGTSITISRNFMGGHWCKLNQYTNIRCERVQ